jgi:hypothetical protein
MTFIFKEREVVRWQGEISEISEIVRVQRDGL